MTEYRTSLLSRVPLRPLSMHEIERRMEWIVAEVTPHAEARAAVQTDGGHRLQPRWISPAELVRRMSRFVVYN